MENHRMPDPIRWAILGTGTVARAFARGLQFTDGALGAIHHLTDAFALPSAADIDGALLDRGVYCLNLAHHLLGPPAHLNATAIQTAANIDTQSTYQLSYSNGATAMLWSSL